MNMLNDVITKILLLSAVSFAIAFFLTPALTHFLYKYKCWKKKVRTVAPDGSATPIFAKLHGAREINTPRMGGILIWGSVCIVTVIAWVSDQLGANQAFDGLNFLNRSQTWIPLFTLIYSSILGLFDDILVIKGIGPTAKGAGLSFRFRALVVALIGFAGGYWFYSK